MRDWKVLYDINPREVTGVLWEIDSIGTLVGSMRLCGFKLYHPDYSTLVVL